MSDIWGDLTFCLQDANINFPNFSAWLCYLHINLSREAFELAATVCWRIWYFRNVELFEGLKCVKNDIVGWSTNFLDEYRRASICEAHSGTHRAAASKWSPPPAEIIKINFDAGFPRGKKYFQVAMVARNHNNQCVWWSIRKLQGRPKIADGEARAALHAMIVAIDRGWRKIMIEVDSLEVINALHRGVDGMESLVAIISECLSISKTFVTCSFSFVKRDGNPLAHSLVQQNVIDMMEDSILPHNREKFI
ncbi:PREDICTED: uncharacterized protein LOC105957013 [Erythranthe guttata]|uniref:uncharacterized protein LOC105957013 n=1 Tax=Erythranthe guttata TaxID=4155 RepID=UPI00064D8D2E|nr:PREDICTED: uncharacterized protein LOC105957013 [Erythranthe guttata]|eukprot:XP_012836377.1 PREDICTED: uncharacterized protein LOC105957013 [Erythranthe guttata]